MASQQNHIERKSWRSNQIETKILQVLFISNYKGFEFSNSWIGN